MIVLGRSCIPLPQGRAADRGRHLPLRRPRIFAVRPTPLIGGGRLQSALHFAMSLRGTASGAQRRSWVARTRAQCSLRRQPITSAPNNRGPGLAPAFCAGGAA